MTEAKTIEQILINSTTYNGITYWDIKEGFIPELRVKPEAIKAIQALLIKAQIREIDNAVGLMTGLDKSHVGRSYYNRNTAFKNYAVKFWNNRISTKRAKLLERKATLTAQLKEVEK
jgi:hypothetical protein